MCLNLCDNILFFSSLFFFANYCLFHLTPTLLSFLFEFNIIVNYSYLASEESFIDASRFPTKNHCAFDV